MRLLVTLVVAALAACSETAPGATDGGTVRDGEIACTSDRACTGATPHCDTARGACVGCRVDGDCGSLFCEPISGECRFCVTDTHCAPEGDLTWGCDPTQDGCALRCMTDGDCPQTGIVEMYCTTFGFCVNGAPDCTLTDGCGSDYFCDPETHRCAECMVDGDCPPSAPTCGPWHFCQPICRGDWDCAGGFGAQICDPSTMACVGCLTNADCFPEPCLVDFTCG